MDQRIEDAVQSCLLACKDTEYPFRCVFEFVRKLVEQDGWREEEAREVGTESLKRIQK